MEGRPLHSLEFIQLGTVAEAPVPWLAEHIISHGCCLCENCFGTMQMRLEASHSIPSSRNFLAWKETCECRFCHSVLQVSGMRGFGTNLVGFLKKMLILGGLLPLGCLFPRSPGSRVVRRKVHHNFQNKWSRQNGRAGFFIKGPTCRPMRCPSYLPAPIRYLVLTFFPFRGRSFGVGNLPSSHCATGRDPIP